jgi:cytochrome c peroxidase
VAPDATGDAGSGPDAIDYETNLSPLLEQAGAAPLEAPDDIEPAKLELGRMLYFDPIMSGNRDTACSTCHRMDEGTTVHRSLVVGTAAVERDGKRMPGPGHSFTPRNSPALFNLGDAHIDRLLWDGRVGRNDEGDFVIFDRGWEKSEQNYLRFLSTELDNLLAAQTMMPVLVRDELRGDHGEVDVEGNPNELATVHDQDLEEVWSRLVERLMALPEYRRLFAEAYPSLESDDVEFAHASNALSAFIIGAFTHDDSPWDRYLRGEVDALDEQAKQGAYVFYGKADCASCHSGPLQTDHQLRNIGVRPIGPGPELDYGVDLGAAFRTHAGVESKYAFRTPSLRNVELTGPWMHNGAYTTLEAAVRHHLDVERGLREYDPTQLDEEFRAYVHQRDEIIEEVLSTLDEPTPIDLTDQEVDALVAFLESLTSPSARDMTHLEPEALPSGLPVADP